MTIFKIIIRSLIVATLVGVISLSFSSYMFSVPDTEFIDWCQSEGFKDPECSAYIEYKNSESNDLSNLELALDLFNLFIQSTLAFFGALFFGLWQYFFPIQKS